MLIKSCLPIHVWYKPVFVKKIDLIKNLTLIALLLSESVYSFVFRKHAKELIFRCNVLLNDIGIGMLIAC